MPQLMIPIHASRRARRGLVERTACLSFIIALSLPGSLGARTVLLDIEQCDQAAAIHAEAPRLSWAGDRHTRHNDEGQPRHNSFVTTRIALMQQSALLVRFDLNQLPDGHRIVHAELVVPVRGVQGNQPRFYLWRVLADWGPGVNHLYRRITFDRDSQTYEKIPWTRSGARGISSDRATRPTDIIRLNEDEATQKVVNVTEDVALWYDQHAPNHGWLFTVEDPGTEVRLRSPIYQNADLWTLRITYEPRDP